MATIFLQGPSGSGKTVLATSITDLGIKLWLDDLDAKAYDNPRIRPLVDSGKVHLRRLSSQKLLAGKPSERMRMTGSKSPILKRPEGFMEYTTWMDEFEALMTAGKDADGCRAYCIDSFTTLQEHYIRYLEFVNKTDRMSPEMWGWTLQNFEEMFSSWFEFHGRLFDHIIVTAHEMTEKDEDTGRIEILPLIGGQMRNKVGKFFQELYKLKADTEGNKRTFKLYTAASDRDRFKANTLLPIDIEMKDTSLATILRKGGVAK